MQLTNYGISGIPVFQLSRVAARALSEQKKVYATLNFVPLWEKEQCLTYFKERFKKADEKRIGEALIGFSRKINSGIIRRVTYKSCKICQPAADRRIREIYRYGAGTPGGYY